MATFNFGQQINQSLESAFNRIERAAERAQQVQQLMEEREIAQQVRLAQQQFRERQLSLQEQQLNMQRAAQQATQEFREEQFNVQKERTKQLSELTKAQIENLRNPDKEKVNPNVAVNAGLSTLKRLENEKQELDEQIQQARQAVSSFEFGMTPAGTPRPERPTGFLFFDPSEQELAQFRTDSTSFSQDSAAAVTRLNELLTDRDQMEGNINELQRAINEKADLPEAASDAADSGNTQINRIKSSVFD